MKYKVFIDGQEGTTGLKIYERFKNRNDIEILRIDDELRKDLSTRKTFINSSDFTFLCLPDIAAIEAVSLVCNENVKIIDASTAHRTNKDWVYGLPELSRLQREKIATSNRVAVPGCYASGFITAIYPLVKSGLLRADFPLTCHAISGYSGGGKKMIAEYESHNKEDELFAPRHYGLAQNHKHLNEMQLITGLSYKPMFNPIVDDFYSGMLVSVPILTRELDKKTSLQDIYEILAEHYKNEYFVRVNEPLTDGFLGTNNLVGTNMLDILVSGNDEQVLVCARLDNLLKGASGAAIQCMNIMMGIDEKTGLI